MLIESLSKQTGVPLDLMKKFVASSRYRYKVYKIPKRNGGERTIHHPSKELKVLQRLLVQFLFSKYPVHSCVRSYVKGIDILGNAADHVRNNFLMRLDFADFFPSFGNQLIEKFLRDKSTFLKESISDDDIQFVCKMVCYDGRLTIGAPSSPVLTNIMMFEFDSIVYERCRSLGVVYTRYADDLFFSTSDPGVLVQLLEEIKELVSRNRVLPGFKLNHDKTTFTSRKRRKVVTGLVLTSENKISIGRSKKREIKSMIHRHLDNKLSGSEKAKLSGILSYVVHVEPIFIESLRKKYGAKEVDGIF